MAMLDAPEWRRILDRVRCNHPNLTRHWFEQLRPDGLEHGHLRIRCANLPQRRYLGQHCLQPFSEAAQIETGCLVSVSFEIDPAGLSAPAPADEIVLDPEYVFDNFVTGPCNRLAHAASLAASDTPGEAYNPLFIHGQVGLGKTHLLQAICQRTLGQRPGLRILYLPCETFINHFLEAVENGGLHGFRFRYRHVELLLIDDVQFLAERERSQEEFFHTFNTLYQTRRQIVLSADCCPRDIPSLEDRLVSRFNWGLVARIDPPCLETRMAIVRKKARRRQVEIPEEVVHLIASVVDSNTRELEGAINVIDALSQQLGRPIDLALAREALGDQGASSRQPTTAEILDAVARHFHVRKSDLQGRRRHKSITLPRQVCMYLSRELTPHSLGEIGSFYGGRDHATVIHAVRSIARLQQEDAHLLAVLRELKSRLLDAGPA